MQAAGEDAAAVLGRSPRLNALLLAHVRAESAETRRAIEEYLEARTAPFVLIARRTCTAPADSGRSEPRC